MVRVAWKHGVLVIIHVVDFKSWISMERFKGIKPLYTVLVFHVRVLRLSIYSHYHLQDSDPFSSIFDEWMNEWRLTYADYDAFNLLVDVVWSLLSPKKVFT